MSCFRLDDGGYLVISDAGIVTRLSPVALQNNARAQAHEHRELAALMTAAEEATAPMGGNPYCHSSWKVGT